MKSVISTVKYGYDDELFKTLSEESPVGVCITQDGKFRYFNSNFPLATGYTTDELMCKDPLELIVPEDREMVRKNEIRMLKGELTSPYQFRVIHKDGTIRWVMETVRSIQYHGRPAVLGNYMEVTERKLMEEAIRQSEERYKELANSITDVFFAMDEHLRYTYWNRASEVLTGIQAKHAIGKSIQEVFPAKPWRRKAEEIYRNVINTQRPQTFVNDYDVGGRHYILEISAYPSRGGVSVFVKDITENKQAEKVAELQRAYFQQLFDSSPDAIVMLDTDTKVVQANQGFERLFGYSLEEIKGRTIKELIIPEDRLEEASAVSQAVFHGQVFRTESVGRRKDGSLLDASIVAYPIRFDGKLVGIYSIYTDITDRKRVEHTLREAEEEKSALLEEAPVAIIHADLQGKITYVNKRFELESGYSREEIIGKEGLQLGWFSADTTKYFAERMAARLSGSPARHWETQFKCKDGHWIWIELEGKILMRLAVPAGFQIIATNITERKRAEEALRESEERYRALFDRSLDSVYVHDFEGNFLDANETALKLLGYQTEDIPHLNFASMLSEDQLHTAIATLQELRDTGTQKQVNQYRLRCKDGSIVDVETRAVLIYHEGKPYAIQGVGRDVTERKKVEEALGKSEERYRTLAENAGEAIFVVQDDVVKFINPKGVELCGYSGEELASRPFAKFIYPDDIPMVADRYLKRLRGELAPQTYDFRIIRKDGHIRWGELNAVPISWEDRPAVLCFMSDITERKQAVDGLRQSEERYRTILEEMEDAYFEVDLGGHLAFVNSSVCRDLGYSREELMGKSYKDFTAPDDIASVFRVFNEVYRTGVPNKGFPWKTVRKDGSHGFAETSISPLRNDRGEIIGFRGVGRDITERKRAEEKLQQSEENYRALFDSAVIGIVVRDAETMRIVMVNQAAVKMFGFSSVEEALEADPFGFVPPEERERYTELAKKAMLAQTSHEPYEIRAMTTDGREKWINVTATPIMHKGKLASLISFIDITEQKRQTERLMLTDRLASIGELAAGAAHELNNPLTSIIGFSQLLMEREVPDDIREHLKLMNTEAQRAASVTRNLLTFARKHAPAKEPNQINSIIEGVLGLRAHEHKVNSIEVERQFDPDLPEVMVDYFQMQQAFLNIIINAEYFMIQAHNRGMLTITTERQNGSVRISFTDDGPGIPQENLRRIFDPFFTTKEAGKGTGLGLSICHGIVTEHGGQIYAASQPGKGATILIELPINGSNHVEVKL